MRYILFAGDAYYPSGGVNDIVATFNDLEYAKEHAEKPRKRYPEFMSEAWTEHYDWANILDTETLYTYRRQGSSPESYTWEERNKIGA